VKKLLCTSKLSGAIQSVAKLASITFLSLALSYWIDYLGFITEGKLAAMLITPSLGVPNWSVIISSTPHHHSCPKFSGGGFWGSITEYMFVKDF
jgi:hypothetical protein